MASENEKAELHKAIWGIADSVRGAVDGWILRTSTRLPCHNRT